MTDAEGLLDEIQELLQKYEAALLHRNDCIVLAVQAEKTGGWRAIAQVKVITAQIGLSPGRIDWRPVEWKQ